MVSIKISGRKVTISDALREQVETKIGGALKVFDIKPMTCDVVLRVDKNHSYGKRNACEVTVFVRDNVVRVVATGDDLEAAIDEAASKVTRQLRKYKTRIIDKRQRSKRPEPVLEPMPNVAAMKMIVYHPVSYEDAQNIIDNLKSRKPVIVNMEELDVAAAQRILDFISGAIYAINGTIAKISRGIFVVAPNNYDVIGNESGEYEDL